jgi:hypothetical protein
MAKRYWFREGDDAASEGLTPGESDKCFVLADDYDLLKAENERLRALLIESKRPHLVCDGDCWYSCPASGECCNEKRSRTECDCGANEWNAKVDAILTV